MTMRTDSRTIEQSAGNRPETVAGLLVSMAGW